MGSETKAHPQRWDNFGNRRSAMDRAGKYLTLPYLTYDRSCLSSNLKPKGPFVANTSHPILLIGNTAGMYFFIKRYLRPIPIPDPRNPIVGVSSLYLFQVGTNSIYFSANKMSRGFNNSVVLTQNSSGVNTISLYHFFVSTTSLI